jgi:hypothetical protein
VVAIGSWRGYRSAPWVDARDARVSTYVGDGDGLGRDVAKILEQVLDQDGALGDLARDLDLLLVGSGEVDHVGGSWGS